jgi:hypothetical protein
MSRKKFYPQTEIWFRQAVYANMRKYGGRFLDSPKDPYARKMFLLMIEEALRGSDFTVTELAEMAEVSVYRIGRIFREYNTSVRRIRGGF